MCTMYIHAYIHTSKEPGLLYVTAVNIKKITYFFHADIFWNCIPTSVYVCVKDKCWKFSIYYKFTKKELLTLTKGITWRHSNIVLKSEKRKFSNTLKNNVQLGDEINGTNRAKQLQNSKTNIERKTACLSQLTNRGRRCRSNRKIYSPPSVA